MSLSRLRSELYVAGRRLGDLQAIMKGRVARRLVQKALGRTLITRLRNLIR